LKDSGDFDFTVNRWKIAMNPMTASVEDTVAALFQPDVLVAPEVFEGLRQRTYQEPDARLMLAILHDAVACFQENIDAQDAKKRNLFLEAEQWILNQDKDWIFSFENICEILGLDPEYMRGGLLRWKTKRLSCGRKRNSQLC
jgi:hypothetical protein